MSEFKQINIKKWFKKHTINAKDFIATESALEIRLGHNNDNFQTLAITMCTPSDIKDLVLGQLFTENIISHSQNVVKINVFETEFGNVAEVVLHDSITYKKHLNKRHGMVHASCGLCGKTQIDDIMAYKYPIPITSQQDIDPEKIVKLPQLLKNKQKAFKQTGGLHASALFDEKGCLLFLREDVGRHNALDKLIGCALQNDMLPLSNKIVLLSGRVSFELVHKSLLAGVPLLCAIGAPSTLCLEVANFNKMNLIGFLKEGSFNLY